MIRRIIITLILFALIIPVGGVNAACDISIYDIMVNPPIAQSEACVSVLFISSCDYGEGEYLTIGLPLGSELPYGCRNCGANIDGRSDRVTYSGNTITIQLNSMLNSGRHRFYICNVTNPPSKGPHFVTITTRDGVFTSSPFDFSDTSIRAAEVEVDPDYVDACAEYEITFKTSATESSTCGCKKKTSITIQFPKGFVLPQEIDPQFVLVNGRPVAYVGVSGTTITITPQSNLDANQTVRVKILSGAGIKNPKTPGWYKLKIHTSADRIPAESESFYIRPSTVTRAKVKIDDPFTCAKGSFTIDFKTGPYGEIKKGQEIHIIFPPGFTIPEEIGEGSVAINNVPVTNIPKYGVDNIDSWKRIMIDSPVDVAAESDIQIIIFESAGIVLPENPGSDYQLDIRTSSEFYRVPSWSFSISNSRLRNVTLEISPVFVSLPSVTKVTFKLGGCGNLKPGYDTINVSFGTDFWFPETTLMTDITVNGVPVDKLVIVDGHKITLSPPEEIAGGEWVTIVFGEKCGIRNPSKAGIAHKVRVWTNREPEPSPSTVVIFATTKISGVHVELDKHMTTKWTGGKISFVLGKAGALKSGSEIKVVFPEDFDFKGSVSTRTITINGEKPKRVSWSRPNLILSNNNDIEAGSAVEIGINEAANLRNPETAGYYSIFVSTSAEPEPIPSVEFGVNDPMNIICKLTPEEPDGLDGWYATQPTLEIIADNSLDDYPQIYCDINFEVMPYTAPMLLEDGFTVITITAKDKFGNTAEHSLSLEIDSHPPTFEPESGRIYSRSKSHRESVEVAEENKFTVDYDEGADFDIEVTRSGMVFITTRCQEEKTIKTSFTATDEAGNSATWEREIVFDWTEPLLELPKSIETKTSVCEISGKTEPGSTLMCTYEKGFIINVDDDGSFRFEIRVKDGYNKISFTSTDSAGNRTEGSVSVYANLKSTVVIEIGKTEATVNGESTTLSHAPYLKDGNTMIPLRFVSSSLGAEIGYDAQTKKITVKLAKRMVEMIIGNKTALVNGEALEMPVAPELVSGSTFVPLRFLCENLNMKISVSGKKITISYVAE